jgi:hypothetical protein
MHKQVADLHLAYPVNTFKDKISKAIDGFIHGLHCQKKLLAFCSIPKCRTRTSKQIKKASYNNKHEDIASSENGKRGSENQFQIDGKCTGNWEAYSWLILLRGPKASCSRLERSLSWRLRIFRLPSADKI